MAWPYSTGLELHSGHRADAKPGATVVAYWQDGTILAVHGKRRVDLNMMPADDTVI